jgi:hypothetical protein|tara:strand:- start:136 stop:324 length:189 start_codon:yes stop_codon:yes gene_type:complete
MTKLRIEKIKDFFLRKEREGKKLLFFEKIGDQNTSDEQIKENIKNLLIKQGFKYVPSKKDNK